MFFFYIYRIQDVGVHVALYQVSQWGSLKKGQSSEVHVTNLSDGQVFLLVPKFVCILLLICLGKFLLVHIYEEETTNYGGTPKNRVDRNVATDLVWSSFPRSMKRNWLVTFSTANSKRLLIHHHWPESDICLSKRYNCPFKEASCYERLLGFNLASRLQWVDWFVF